MADNAPKQARFYIDDSIQERLDVLLSDPPRESEHVKRVLVPVPEGSESKDVSDAWIKCFGRWAAQEGLSDDLALLFASEYMQECDYSWARQFSVGHTWEDFVRRYFQRTITSDVQVAQGQLYYPIHISLSSGSCMHLQSRLTVAGKCRHKSTQLGNSASNPPSSKLGLIC